MLNLDLYINAGSLRAVLLLSLLSVWVLVGLFFYLNRFTRRIYFTFWSIAWVFYAGWISLNFLFLREPGLSYSIWKQWALGFTAFFLLWGTLRFAGYRVRRSLMGLLALFLLTWNFAAAATLRVRWHFELPFFALIAGVTFWTAWVFFRYRSSRGFRGATLLAAGFSLWGFFFAFYPFLQQEADLQTVGFFIATLLQLFIAVSMIILVLEEVRTTKNLALHKIREQRNEKTALVTKVQSTEERYRSLFDQASEAIIIASSEDLRILELNSTAERLLGIHRNDAPSQQLSSFCQSRNSPGFKEKSSEEWFQWLCQLGSLTLVNKSGGNTPVEVDGAAIEFEGKPAYQFFFREITERSRLEQQLRQAEKLSALGQMISGVAHELNNPLAVIKGYLELILAHHQLNSQTRSDLQKVAQECNRAAKLVRNFLTFGREQHAHREMVNMNELIQRVAELRRFDMLIGGVELRLELSSQLPPTYADPDQVQQLIINLITNAIQAMVDRPTPRILRVSSRATDELLEILVEDNGPGVPEEIIDKIFEPFFTTKEVGTGTGLGLSIAHGIMADHHGRISYEKSSLGGACFALEFPVVVAPAAAQHTSSPGQVIVPMPVPGATLPKCKILVLDDEKSIAEMLCEMLNILGHEPTLCTASPQAVELIQSQEFDLVLSDYRMPIMNGQEFYNAVKASKPALAQRIIFLTGDVMNQETQSFLDSIGNPHLSKPFQLTHVEAVIARLLQNHTAKANVSALNN